MWCNKYSDIQTPELMKTIQSKHFFFFAGIFVFLTGCPAPNPFHYNSIKKSDQSGITYDYKWKSIYWRIDGVHPWFDTQKKVITVTSYFKNVTNEGISIDANSIKLESKKEHFDLITTNIGLINPFKIDTSSLTIKPTEFSTVTLYFVSEGNYTKQEYHKSLKKDTLLLTMEVLKEKHTVLFFKK
jgi:hypothetical protein